MPGNALVLVGHGSHISPETAGVVWEQVDQLRALNVADEVTAAFWKEMPSFHQVIDTLAAEDVTIVPLFTAQGYFTQTVIPAEMELDGRDHAARRTDAALHADAGRASAIWRRWCGGASRRRCGQSGADPADAAVAIIGHGTRRSPESRRATLAQAEQVRDMAAEAVAVFLDDAPCHPRHLRADDAAGGDRRAVLSGARLAHDHRRAAASSVSRRAERSGESTGGRSITRRRSASALICVEAILEIARDAGSPLREPSPARRWDGFPTAGREP